MQKKSEESIMIHELNDSDVNTANDAKIEENIIKTDDFVELAATTGWSDSAKELIESLPQVWTRGLLYFLLVFSSIVIPWAMVTKVDETGTGRGKLEPQGSPNRLEASVSGTVISVRAQEGDMVKQGQVLLELESDNIRSDLRQSQNKLEGQKNRLSQLLTSESQVLVATSTQQQQNQALESEKLAQADQAQQTLIDKQSAIPLLELSTVAQIRQAQKALNDSRSVLVIQELEKAVQINQASQKLIAAKTEYALINNRHKKKLRELQRYKVLFKQGVVSEIKVVEIDELAAESERLLSQGLADVNLSSALVKEQKINSLKIIQQLKADVQRNEFQLQEKRRDYQKLTDQQKSDIKQADIKLREQREGQKGLKSTGALSIFKNKEQLDDIQSQISKLKTEILESENQIKELDRQVEVRIIKAPVDGIVIQFPFKQVKSFVQVGQLVTQLAPQKSSMILKTQMPSQESGFLKAGMPVKVKFDAYPFQDYGVVTGQVKWISPDSKIVENTGNKQEVFELDIVLDKNYIQYRGKNINLNLGQTASAEVVTGQKKIGDFILDPFKKLGQGGLKL